jgi:uncharacterized protein (DUF1501 family)
VLSNDDMSSSHCLRMRRQIVFGAGAALVWAATGRAASAAELLKAAERQYAAGGLDACGASVMLSASNWQQERHSVSAQPLRALHSQPISD